MISSHYLSRFFGSWFCLCLFSILLLSLLQVILPFVLLTFFNFLRSSILLIISCVIHGLLAFLSIFPSKSITVCNTHFLILFQHTSTFPHSHSIALSFSFWVSCTIRYWTCNFSKFSLGFPFWNLMIFCNLVVPKLLMWSFHMKIHKIHSTNNYLTRHRDKKFCK